MKKHSLFGFLFVVLALIVASCAPAATPVPPTQVPKATQPPAAPQATQPPVPTKAPEPTKAAAPTKVFRIANAEPTWTLDPGVAVTSASWRVIELLTDPLLDRDKDFKLIPWVAEKWDMQENGKVWVFTIRKNAKFSDGSPITADDVKFSFEYLKPSDLWKSKLNILSNVEVIDPQTVKVTLTEPRTDFFEIPSASVQYPILSKAAVTKAGTADQGKVSAVSGPYILKEYVPKDHLVLVRNPYYWKLADGYPKFDEIRWSFTEDPTAGVAAIEAGSADLYSPVPAASVDRLKKNSNVKVFQATMPSYTAWGMNKDKPPFNDKRVRQAIGYAVEPDERTTVCWFTTGTSLYGGAVYAWQSFYSKDDPVEPWKKPRAERLTMAKTLLDAAGWVEGPGGMRVSKGVSGLPDGTPFKFDARYESNWPAAGCHAQLLQKWMKDIGIQANPVAYDPSIFWQDVGAGKMDFFHSGWYSYLSPRQLYDNNWACDGYGNQYMVRACSPELDKAIKAADAETDPTKQAAMYHEIEKMVADLQFAILVGSQDSLVLTNGKLAGFFPRSDDSNRALIVSDIP